MKLNIILISTDDVLVSKFGTEKDALIPKAVLGKGAYKNISPSFDMIAYRPNFGESLATFLSRKVDDTSIDNILFLVDESYLHLLDGFNQSFFFYPFSMDDLGNRSHGNFIAQSMAKLLRAFSIVHNHMNDATGISLMGLPVRNFKSKELAEIAEICNQWYKINDFSSKLQTSLSHLKKRRRPAPRTGKKAPKFIIDDNENLFELGKEKHAQIETGAPHVFFCYASGHFRFGKRIDARKHYNVSKATGRISGDFSDCHGEECVVKPTTHINMFSNDYIA